MFKASGMNRNVIFGALLGLFLLAPNLKAQDDVADIKKAVMTMFEGMRAGDSSMVHSVILDDVTFQRVTKDRQGKTVVSNSSFQNFLRSIGTPHDKVWDEQIEFGSVHVDGDMAAVWTPFKFFLGDQFSHCGVNAFKLVRTEKGWKIFHLVDTSRKDNCAM